MKNSRRMQRLVETQIIHNMATSKLPMIVPREMPKPVAINLAKPLESGPEIAG